jgi:hypothetical protein
MEDSSALRGQTDCMTATRKFDACTIQSLVSDFRAGIEFSMNLKLTRCSTISAAPTCCAASGCRSKQSFVLRWTTCSLDLLANDSAVVNPQHVCVNPTVW